MFSKCLEEFGIKMNCAFSGGLGRAETDSASPNFFDGPIYTFEADYLKRRFLIHARDIAKDHFKSSLRLHGASRDFGSSPGSKSPLTLSS